MKKYVVDDYEFYKGECESYPIVISKTEIGIMNSAVSTMIGIKEFNPCIILNQGTAGGYGKNIHRGDIVIAQDCFNLNSYKTSYLKQGEGSNPLAWKLQTFYDGEDCYEKIQADKGLLRFIKQHEQKIWNEKIVYGTAASGDCWNREMDRIQYLNQQYGAICEDMETIGTYRIAKRYNIPTIGIRVIADNEILCENYDRSIANKSQMFTIFLCKQWIKEGRK